MTHRPLHVIIAGGGIGGLCLAQGLHAAGISVAVYERDAAPDARLRGYRLNIEPVGSRALHECLPPHLWEILVATAGDPGRGMGVFTERLHELMREDDPPAGLAAFERTHAVSRVTLSRVLLTGLDEIVHFGKECSHYEQSPDGVTAHFTDGSAATGDLLVGADGVRSRVRRQLLPDAKEINAPGIGIGGKLPLTDQTAAWLPAPLTVAKNMILPKRDFLFTAVFRRRDSAVPSPMIDEVKDDDYVMWAYVAHNRAFPSGVRGQDLRDLIAPRVASWHPDLQRLIASTPADTVEQFDFAAAARVKPWPTTTVTLLGDAIHYMPPVGGLGGNAALHDASLLCRALISVSRGESDLLTVLAGYERAMLTHGFGSVRAALMYLRLAILRSRVVRAVARTFFRLCGAIGPLRRAVFAD